MVKLDTSNILILVRIFDKNLIVYFRKDSIIKCITNLLPVGSSYAKIMGCLYPLACSSFPLGLYPPLALLPFWFPLPFCLLPFWSSSTSTVWHFFFPLPLYLYPLAFFFSSAKHPLYLYPLALATSSTLWPSLPLPLFFALPSRTTLYLYPLWLLPSCLMGCWLLPYGSCL